MAARLVGMPAWQFLDDQAAVLAGGSLTFKEPGTSTDKSIWKDAAKNTEHSNPITLDAAGRPPNPVFSEGLYDVTVKDSAGTTITTISNWGTNFSTNSEQSPNLVCNYSFEDDDDADGTPDEWTFVSGSSGARITSDQQHGAASVKFTSTSSSSDEIASCYIPVSDNCAYEVYLEYKTSNASCTPQLDMAEYDASQSFSQDVTLWAPSSTQTSWTKTARFRYTPTSGAKWARVSIIANTAGTAYDTYIDNVYMHEVSTIPAATFRPNGLEISRDSGDTDHDLNVTAGSVIADDGVYPLVLEQEITKQIDLGFSAGDDSGGLANGSSIPADGILYLYLIGDSDTGAVDVLIDESPTSPTMPSGWDKKQYIGGWRTDSSNNLEPGTNKGSFWWWNVAIIDQTLTNQSASSDQVVTVTAPPFAWATMTFRLDGGTGNVQEAEIQKIGPTDHSPTSNTSKAGLELGSGNINEHSFYFQVQLDASSQFDYSLEDPQSGDLDQVDVTLIGWLDLKREYGL